MTELVSIDQIKVDRTLAPDDDVTELAKDIRANGLVVPVLIDRTYRLIDGLRRLEATKSLGDVQIEAVVTSMYPTACANLKQAREHGAFARPFSTRRIFEMYEAMIPLMNYTRSQLGHGTRRGKRLKSPPGGRRMFTEVMGLSSTSYLQALVQLYRYCSSDDEAMREKATTATRRLEAGELTVYGAQKIAERKEKFNGRVLARDAQLDLLNRALATLRGLLRGLEEMGPISSDFSKEEVQVLAVELAKQRTKLASFVRTFNKEFTNNG